MMLPRALRFDSIASRDCRKSGTTRRSTSSFEAPAVFAESVPLREQVNHRSTRRSCPASDDDPAAVNVA